MGTLLKQFMAGVGGGRSWSSYWATHFAALQTILDGQSDLNFWAKSRSGNYFVDEYGHNAQIKTPAILCSGTNSYFRIASATIGITGGAAWDVIFKFRLDDITRRDCLFENGGSSNVNKGITIMPYNGNLVIYSSDGTNAYRTITFNCGFQNNVDYTLRFQWDGSTDGTVTATVNGTPYTSTNVRGWSGAPGGSDTDFGSYAGTYRFKGIYRSIVGTLGGVPLNFHPNGYYANSEWDTSVSGRILTFTRYAGATRCWEGDSTNLMDYGFSWQKANTSGTLIPVQYTTDGEFVSLHALLGGDGGVTVLSRHPGSLTKHNLAPSYIRFAGDFFDRSDTTIWNATSRESSYYLSATPKDLYITELNYLTLKSWLNVGYKGMFYIKADTQSVEDTTTIDELFCYTTDRISHDQIKSLIYSNDVRRCQRTIDGDYTFDSDDYAEIYLYDNLGGDAEANYAKYQALITAGDLTLVTGYNQYDVITIARPLKVPSNRTLTINCELRIKDASFANLTANVSINDTVIAVDDVSEFAVGDYIAISDNILPIQGGSAQTRRVASCGIITEVGETTLTINYGSNYNVSAASGGKVGHCQPVVLVDSVSNVNIYGSGIVNARWQKQYDVEAVWHAVEALEFGSGIAVMRSPNCKVLGTPLLTLRHALLHNVVFSGGTWAGTAINGEVGNLDSGYAHDKNVLFATTDGIYVHDVEAHHAVFEDGVIFYLSNINMTIDDINAHDNARGSVTLLSNGACGAELNNIISDGSMFLTSSDIIANNIAIIGAGSYLAINSSYSGGNNITINGLSFEDIVNTRLLVIEGAVDGININDCIIDGCNTSVGAIVVDDYSSGGVFPQNVVFTGGGIYNHTGTAFAIDASADVTFTDFDNAPV